jgi:hypothetical protein
MSKFFEFLTSSFYSLSSARKRSPKTLWRQYSLYPSLTSAGTRICGFGW